MSCSFLDKIGRLGSRTKNRHLCKKTMHAKKKEEKIMSSIAPMILLKKKREGKRKMKRCVKAVLFLLAVMAFYFVSVAITMVRF